MDRVQSSYVRTRDRALRELHSVASSTTIQLAPQHQRLDGGRSSGAAAVGSATSPSAAAPTSAQHDLDDLRILAEELARYGVAVEDVLRSCVRDLARRGATRGAGSPRPPGPDADALRRERVKLNTEKIRNTVFGTTGRQGAASSVVGTLQRSDPLSLVNGAAQRAARRDKFVRELDRSHIPTIPEVFLVTYPAPVEDAAVAAADAAPERTAYTNMVANALDIVQRKSFASRVTDGQGGFSAAGGRSARASPRYDPRFSPSHTPRTLTPNLEAASPQPSPRETADHAPPTPQLRQIPETDANATAPPAAMRTTQSPLPHSDQDQAAAASEPLVSLMLDLDSNERSHVAEAAATRAGGGHDVDGDAGGGEGGVPIAPSAAGFVAVAAVPKLPLAQLVRRSLTSSPAASARVSTPTAGRRGSEEEQPALKPGERALGRRDSDLVWLNEARSRGQRPTVHVRRPPSVRPGVWKKLSPDAQAALSGADEPVRVVVKDDLMTRTLRTRAAYDAVVAANPIAFNEYEAQVAEDTYRNLASKARERLAQLRRHGEEPRDVGQFHEAVALVERSRPFFVPSLGTAELTRVSRRGGIKPAAQVAKWSLGKSLFDRRRLECDARDCVDPPDVWAKQFEMDWERIVMKERFLALVARSDRNMLKNNPAELKRELDEIKEVLQRYTVALATMFMYYSNTVGASWASDDTLSMTLERFRALVDDIGVIDPKGRTCRSRNELDCVFVAANFEANGQGDDADANDNDALVRFEFHEIIVRLAFAKFIDSKALADASDAVQTLLEDWIIPNAPPEAIVDPNEFRFTRMYTEATEAVVVRYHDMLRGVFQVLKAKDRTKYFWLEHWKALLDECRLLSNDESWGLTANEARLIFAWSQMAVVDELKKRQRAVSLVFFDFLEAVCRLADKLGLPSRREMEEYFGGKTPAHPWGEYWRLAVVQDRGDQSPRATGGSRPTTSEGVAAEGKVWPRIVRRESGGHVLEPQTRPLAEKLEALCDLVLFSMMRAWGGTDLASCAARMHATARTVSGGVELG